jgi:polyhydroxyalkanoate synthesis regulator phasin
MFPTTLEMVAGIEGRTQMSDLDTFRSELANLRAEIQALRNKVNLLEGPVQPET